MAVTGLERARTRDELGRDADLLRGRAEGFLGDIRGHAFHLVEDPAGLHDGHPFLGVALALAHSRLGRLLGHGLVREHADPDLAAALEAARERHAGRLDLAIGDPAGLQGLEAVLAEGERGAALRLALHAAALGLPVFDALRHQHGRALTPPPW